MCSVGPTCKKSIDEPHWRRVQVLHYLEANVMPPEFEDHVALTLCNDCLAKTHAPYHFANLHMCSACGSFNTDLLSKQVVPGLAQSLRQADAHASTSSPTSGAHFSPPAAFAEPPAVFAEPPASLTNALPAAAEGQGWLSAVLGALMPSGDEGKSQEEALNERPPEEIKAVKLLVQGRWKWAQRSKVSLMCFRARLLFRTPAGSPNVPAWSHGP